MPSLIWYVDFEMAYAHPLAGPQRQQSRERLTVMERHAPQGTRCGCLPLQPQACAGRPGGQDTLRGIHRLLPNPAAGLSHWESQPEPTNRNTVIGDVNSTEELMSLVTLRRPPAPQSTFILASRTVNGSPPLRPHSVRGRKPDYTRRAAVINNPGKLRRLPDYGLACWLEERLGTNQVAIAGNGNFSGNTRFRPGDSD